MNIRRGYPLIAVLLLLLVACTAQLGEVSDPDIRQGPSPTFTMAAEILATVVEVMGILVIVKGAVTAAITFVRDSLGELAALNACRGYREQLGLAILLGLEFLVAGDIIRTVAVNRTFRNVGILAGIVAIRTFLSFALEVEIEGRLPWKMNSD